MTDLGYLNGSFIENSDKRGEIDVTVTRRSLIIDIENGHEDTFGRLTKERGSQNEWEWSEECLVKMDDLTRRILRLDLFWKITNGEPSMVIVIIKKF